MVTLGIAPYLHPRRPNAPARWWRAEGAWRDDRLVVDPIVEGDAPGPVADLCGLAAPCSLPGAFLGHLGVSGDRETVLAALARLTRDRLHHEARAFAADRPRGTKYPRRAPAETLSALDRRRLALFHACLPLLRTTPPRLVVEIDVAAWLSALGLPASDRTGESPAAVARRAAILDALREGVLGFPVDVRARDLPVASRNALDAVVAVAAAAWVARNEPSPPADGDEAWIPLP